MGLDMYLSARKYVEKIDWKKMHDNDGLEYKDATLPNYSEIVELSGLSGLDRDIYGASVSITALYWRKANQIHKWFVENVQQGEDNCGEYYVSHEKLDELLAVCEKAYKSRDPQDLMPQPGFFFGSYDIDQYYWEDIKRTISEIKRIKRHKAYDRLSFYYSSSW